MRTITLSAEGSGADDCTLTRKTEIGSLDKDDEEEEITVMIKVNAEIPKSIQKSQETLMRENFFLWMYLASQDLWDDAREYIYEAGPMPPAFDCVLNNSLICADDSPDLF